MICKELYLDKSKRYLQFCTVFEIFFKMSHFSTPKLQSMHWIKTHFFCLLTSFQFTIVEIVFLQIDLHISKFSISWKNLPTQIGSYFQSIFIDPVLHLYLFSTFIKKSLSCTVEQFSLPWISVSIERFTHNTFWAIV